MRVNKGVPSASVLEAENDSNGAIWKRIYFLCFRGIQQEKF